MNKLSRRSLAGWASNQIQSGQPLSGVINKLAAVLIVSRRENQVGMLADDIAYQLEKSGVISSAIITSRFELSEQIRHSLSLAIASATSTSQVEMTERLDDSVLGGVRIKTATRSWDFTVANQLNELRKVL